MILCALLFMSPVYIRWYLIKMRLCMGCMCDARQAGRLFFFLKMSDSESDSNLIQEVYDPEDDLNVYGLPVVRRAAASGEQPLISSAQVPLPERTQVSLRLLCKFTTKGNTPYYVWSIFFIITMFHSAFIILSMQEYLQ